MATLIQKAEQYYQLSLVSLEKEMIISLSLKMGIMAPGACLIGRLRISI
jgi:hypothetical protein